LAVALALLALPLAGTKAQATPILAPLATDLVPLGTSVQAPPAILSPLPSLVAPARLVLGPLPSAVFAPTPKRGDRLQHLTSRGFTTSGAIDSPNGRSPPSV